MFFFVVCFFIFLFFVCFNGKSKNICWSGFVETQKNQPFAAPRAPTTCGPKLRTPFGGSPSFGLPPSDWQVPPREAKLHPLCAGRNIQFNLSVRQEGRQISKHRKCQAAHSSTPSFGVLARGIAQAFVKGLQCPEPFPDWVWPVDWAWNYSCRECGFRRP